MYIDTASDGRKRDAPIRCVVIIRIILYSRELVVYYGIGTYSPCYEYVERFAKSQCTNNNNVVCAIARKYIDRLRREQVSWRTSHQPPFLKKYCNCIVLSFSMMFVRIRKLQWYRICMTKGLCRYIKIPLGGYHTKGYRIIKKAIF